MLDPLVWRVDSCSCWYPYCKNEIKDPNNPFTSVPRPRPQTDQVPLMLRRPPSHLHQHTEHVLTAASTHGLAGATKRGKSWFKDRQTIIMIIPVRRKPSKSALFSSVRTPAMWNCWAADCASIPSSLSSVAWPSCVRADRPSSQV